MTRTLSLVHLLRAVGLLGIGAGVLLSGCASHTPVTAASLMRDNALQRQQADQATAASAAAKPDDRNLYLTLIRQMQDKGLFYASLAHIAEFEKRFGTGADIELLRGDALRETAQGEAALQVYRPLLSTSQAGAAEHGIGRVYATEGRLPEAVAALGAAVQASPTNAFYLSDLGYAYMLSGQTAAARVPIAQAAELSPQDKKVMANLLLYCYLTGDSVRADAVAAHMKFSDDTVQGTRALAQRMNAANVARDTQAVTPGQTPTVPRIVVRKAGATVSIAMPPDNVMTGSPGTAAAPGAGRAGADKSGPSAFAWQDGPMLNRFGGSP